MSPSEHPALRGCGTALVTPFLDDGSVDEESLRALVEWQIEEGVDFLVPGGSTGEAATLTQEEHTRVVAITAEQARGRVPVVAGAGSNDTARAIRLSRAVVEAGATHLLHVSPSYNKPPQRGLVAHFTAIADAVDRPVVLYNVPGRTASNVEAATQLTLAAHPNIVATKEASGNLSQMGEILRGRPEGFSVLSGDDALTLPLVALGGDGIISVVSNATPRAMAELTRAALSGDTAAARALHHRLAPWMSAAFIESNPIPVKAALAAMGRLRNVLRLPLVPLAEVHRP
ncbi:MAG TPA: 4-hydroxy-tetrahydrodipicolinate synthase, partial [Longimicrobiales bacterium]|nr:4-hydroxy-tetrahydrodipicolinate synthase [Longimicrobiales bacterium]